MVPCKASQADKQEVKKMTDTQKIVNELCDCSKRDLADSCQYKFKYLRWPREVAPGALGLCPKVKNVRF